MDGAGASPGLDSRPAPSLGRESSTPAHRSGGGMRMHLPPWQRVKAALEVDPLAYLHGLGRLNVSARPSSLQPLLKRRQHTLSTLCTPHLDLAGLQFSDIATDRAGGVLPVQGVVQCTLTLGTAAGIPGSGVKERKAWLSVARMCLYDGARFHGNVQAMKPREVKAGKDGGDTWVFDAAPLVVRCPQTLLHRLSMYVEFNASYELTPEEVGRLPAKAERAARQVDEVALAWALIDLRALQQQQQPGGGLAAAKSMNVPLRGGPLAQRALLARCLAPGQPKKSFFGGAEPSLAVRLAPLPLSDPTAALLPAAAIASRGAALVLGLYRMLLVEGLGRKEGAGAACTASIADQTLNSFPAIMDDPDLCHAFFQLWERQTAPRLNPTTAELKAVLRQCTAMVWLMMGSQAIPPASIANHTAHQWQRTQRMAEYLQAHPVATLNTDAPQWLHAPLDAAQLLYNPLRALGPTV